MTGRTNVIALAVAALLAGACGAAQAASLPVFAPHKALYDFKMVSVQSGAGISDIRGKMYYEQDDTCDAWTTDHRFAVEYHYPERAPVLNTSHYVAYEAKDKSQFYFSSDRQQGAEVTEQLRGAVENRADGGAAAEYSRPEELSFDLPQGYFLPNAHTREIIRRAQAGEKIFNAVLFDGTDADGPVEVNAFIGKQAAARAVPKGGGIAPSLLAPQAWNVHMAVFPLADEESMTPAYEMDLVLHANGVVSHVLVDYHSFKVEQNLIALEALPHKDCPPAKE